MSQGMGPGNMPGMDDLSKMLGGGQGGGDNQLQETLKNLQGGNKDVAPGVLAQKSGEKGKDYISRLMQEKDFNKFSSSLTSASSALESISSSDERDKILASITGEHEERLRNKVDNFEKKKDVYDKAVTSVETHKAKVDSAKDEKVKKDLEEKLEQERKKLKDAETEKKSALTELEPEFKKMNMLNEHMLLAHFLGEIDKTKELDTASRAANITKSMMSYYQDQESKLNSPLYKRILAAMQIHLDEEDGPMVLLKGLFKQLGKFLNSEDSRLKDGDYKDIERMFFNMAPGEKSIPAAVTFLNMFPSPLTPLLVFGMVFLKGFKGYMDKAVKMDHTVHNLPTDQVIKYIVEGAAKFIDDSHPKKDEFLKSLEDYLTMAYRTNDAVMSYQNQYQDATLTYTAPNQSSLDLLNDNLPSADMTPPDTPKDSQNSDPGLPGMT